MDFMKAHGRQPLFVMTDQCAAMKQAIPVVFPDSKHRLCLWHITNKLDNKVVLIIVIKMRLMLVVFQSTLTFEAWIS